MILLGLDRLQFLGSFRRLPHEMRASTQIFKIVKGSSLVQNYTSLTLLIQALLFALGFVTCGMAWTEDVRDFLFGVKIARRRAKLTNAPTSIVKKPTNPSSSDSSHNSNNQLEREQQQEAVQSKLDQILEQSQQQQTAHATNPATNDANKNATTEGKLDTSTQSQQQQQQQQQQQDEIKEEILL